MRTISSGRGNSTVPLISLLAFLAISLTVNLPGLAIAPVEGKLDQVFGHVSDLQIQLLQVLPNVVVIPFIILSGKIANAKNQLWVLAIGLIIYALAGIVYLFADTINELILLGCFLGMGCGLVIPLAASLISQYFWHKEKVRFLGMKSGISNGAVIFGTIFVGWMAGISWHLAFLVYLVPLIPLVMIPFMRHSFIMNHGTREKSLKEPDTDVTQALPAKVVKPTVKTFAGLVMLYISMTYASIAFSYYLPFTMQHYGFNSDEVGICTAMFYIGAALSGFALTPIIRVLKRPSVFIAMAVLAGGLFLTAFFHSYASYIAAILLTGLGYGVIQPVIYNKTTEIAPSREASTKYFSYLLAGNYIGISITPFLIDFVAKIFHTTPNLNFSYIANGVFVAAYLIIAFLFFRKSYIFDAVPSPEADRKKR